MTPYCHICGARRDCTCTIPVDAAEYERRKAEAREWQASHQHRCTDAMRAHLPSRVPREYHIEIESDAGPS